MWRISTTTMQLADVDWEKGVGEKLSRQVHASYNIELTKVAAAAADSFYRPWEVARRLHFLFGPSRCYFCVVCFRVPWNEKKLLVVHSPHCFIYIYIFYTSILDIFYFYCVCVCVCGIFDTVMSFGYRQMVAPHTSFSRACAFWAISSIPLRLFCIR